MPCCAKASVSRSLPSPGRIWGRKPGRRAGCSRPVQQMVNVSAWLVNMGCAKTVEERLRFRLLFRRRRPVLSLQLGKRAAEQFVAKSVRRGIGHAKHGNAHSGM